ncbi:MAG: thioredoxin domain-containing protein [Deltaproteobacteria bacterium]|nr:thioredoxin domain-containing protein [Deltaproteobacteria bacterium]
MVASALPLTACNKESGTGSGSTSGRPIDTPARGAQAAKVEMLAFLDFECPYSRGNAKGLLDLAEKHKDSLRIRFLNLPLDVHPNALIAARGAVAAHKQGAYFKYFEKMMVAKSVGRDALLAWAVEAGIDSKKLVADLDSPESLKIVTRDVGLAKVFGISGTPSFVLNGVLYQGAQPMEFWEKKVTEEAQKAQGLLAAGTPSSGLIKAMVGSSNPKGAADYEKYILKGQTPPDAPVPAKVARTSGVESAQIQPAGGGTGAVQIGDPNQGQPLEDNKTLWRVGIRPDDPRMGAETALVTIVAFEDMECPFCAKLRPTLKKLVDESNGKVRLVFKHNPLPFHPHAEAAALALEAARNQKKFWEMYDYLLQHQQNLDATGLADAATTVGLDKAQFQSAMVSQGAKPRIDADVDQAAALGARGTPNLFVNGRKMVGAKEEAALKALIDEEIAKAQEMIKAGTAGEKIYEAIIAKGKLLDSLAPEAKTIKLPEKVARRGAPGAAIEIVTFQDFQCPFSARLDPHLRAIEEEFPGRVRVIWLDYPLDKIHGLAQSFAEAGQQALAQGKFWEFHKAVMANNDRLDDTALVARAKEAGLDLKKLDAALKDHRHAAAVQANKALGDQVGVKGTPTVFINGHLFSPQNGFSANTFRAAIQRLLSAP